MGHDQTVNIEQAAAMCGVSRRSLYYWMSSGRLSFTTRLGSRRVVLNEVKALATKPDEASPQESS